MSRRITLSLILTLAIAAPASAATHHWKRFHTPSALIQCYLLHYGGKGVECTAGYLPDYGEGDSYLRIEPTGTTKHGSRSDFPGYDAPDRALPYGDKNVTRGITCVSRTSGLTCRNKAGHGYHMAKNDTKLY